MGGQMEAESSTSSSRAPAPPVARWRRGFRSRAATGCCCSRPGGATAHPWIHIPIGYHKLYTHPIYNWKFESEPVAGLNSRTSYQPRGKMLGGTSSLNGMVYMRGTPADYDGWRQRGCEGWDYSSVLPYFRKAEDQERGENEFHGVGGPLKVSDSAFAARSSTPSSRRPSRPAFRAIATSTERARRASATTSRPSARAGGGAPRSPI